MINYQIIIFFSLMGFNYIDLFHSNIHIQVFIYRFHYIILFSLLFYYNKGSSPCFGFVIREEPSALNHCVLHLYNLKNISIIINFLSGNIFFVCFLDFYLFVCLFFCFIFSIFVVFIFHFSFNNLVNFVNDFVIIEYAVFIVNLLLLLVAEIYIYISYFIIPYHTSDQLKVVYQT